ncbi:MAG: type IV secretory system conjugative DNA transfer family protein [Firmicutes bacterium]|nr:type IV secretory system conjugative DNA transfer family protein [Bacillota bacterium]
MQARTARALVAGAFGFVPAWLAGMEAASFGIGVVSPVVRALRAAKAAGHPGQIHPGPIWHAWLAGRHYLPWHWGPVFTHPAWALGALGIGAVAGAALAIQAGKASRAATWGGPKAAGKGQFGTAHWRPTRSLGESYARWAAPDRAGQGKAKRRGEAGPGGLLVGTDTLQNPQRAWVLARDEHALILGSTRSGKTRRLILPTIGIVGGAGTESLVLADPKGELYDHTAAWLDRQGYTVIRVDLIRPRPGGTRRFNPLTPVWAALHADPPDPAAAARMARQIAHIITYGSGNLVNTEPLWINGQISLTAAMILAVAATAPRAQAHLAAAYRLLLSAGADEGKSLDRWVADTFPPDHPAALAYGTYQLSQSKTRASIITGTAAGLQLWGDPEVSWLTAAQDHDLAAVGREPTAVFLVVPHDDASRYMAAGLYVSMLFRTLTDLARDRGGRLPLRVNCLLDEFGNLPPFPDFDQFVTVSAGMGIRLVLALQNIEQLRKHYERTERTIRGNMGTWLFLRTSDLQTARELSEMIGRYTTLSESAQYPKVGWTTVTTAVGHTSQGQNLTGRELVTPDELLRWPADQVLVWQAGYPPAKLPLPDLSAWKVFAGAIDRRREWRWPDTPVPSLDLDAGEPDGDTGDDEPIRGEATEGGEESLKGGDGMTDHRTGRVPAEPEIPAAALGPLGGLFAGQVEPLAPGDVPPAGW